jgi:putative transposase
MHITPRGNNRLRCFFSDSDHLVYLELLGKAAHETGCLVHAYVLMTNHIHLLVSPSKEQGPGMMMKSLGEQYVSYVNRRQTRTGTLWEGRFRSCLVQTERYLMVCQRYIELNPVRAQMVSDPAAYSWSSYHRNAHGDANAVVTPHELYDRSGGDAIARQKAYRDLFDEALSVDTLKEVRRATHANSALGNDAFKDHIADLTGRSMTLRDGGRPRKHY